MNWIQFKPDKTAHVVFGNENNVPILIPEGWSVFQISASIVDIQRAEPLNAPVVSCDRFGVTYWNRKAANEFWVFTLQPYTGAGVSSVITATFSL